VSLTPSAVTSLTGTDGMVAPDVIFKGDFPSINSNAAQRRGAH
jgi:hypothetical protein